ncbi:hypothetical protein T4D_16307 [Trichinella pseudospiralis]|uniref:Homeobox domain-containing protein n=1 Tax=Trichinella pseudospiralis TaxID=6337 RepID=A0A0V1FFJ4_TRIPS|nr:hypothetical protein T4D_16307 [Trichinella pseudospiralis]
MVVSVIASVCFKRKEESIKRGMPLESAHIASNICMIKQIPLPLTYMLSDYYWNNQHEQKELTLKAKPGPQQLEIFDSLGRRRPFGRRPLSKQKANILEEYFECSVYLKKEDTARLLARCNLPYNVVRNWFSYTRQKKTAGLAEVIHRYPGPGGYYECIICHKAFTRFLHLLIHLHDKKHKETCELGDGEGRSMLENSPTSESEEITTDTTFIL